MERSIEDIEAELREARQARDAERKRIRDATPVVRRFTILPHSPRRFSEEMYDDNCALYELRAEVINKEEAMAAGHSEHEFREGGMTYVFNKISGRIVCGTGGGTFWVSRGTSEKSRQSANRAMDEISSFIRRHPDGGDITSIVNKHRSREGYGN